MSRELFLERWEVASSNELASHERWSLYEVICHADQEKSITIQHRDLLKHLFTHTARISAKDPWFGRFDQEVGHSVRFIPRNKIAVTESKLLSVQTSATVHGSWRNGLESEV